MARACATAGPGKHQGDGAREKILAKPNEHESNSPHKARRPARGERLRFLDPDRRQTGPTGADRECEPAIRNVPQPPAFVDAHTYRMPLRSQGGFRRGCSSRASCVSISLPAWCPGSRVVEPNNLAFGDASHCCTARLKRLQLERLRALVKQL